MSEVKVPPYLSRFTPTILGIASDDESCLKQRANEVIDCTSEEIRQLVRNMIETMISAKGIGIAAPQVRIAQRVMVFYLPPCRDDVNGKGVPLTVLINPSVEYLDDESMVSDWEGCLSVPGRRGKVKRYRCIRYSGFSPESGERIERLAKGWHARVVQHEFDHLNGILYPDLMAEEDKLLSIEEYNALEA